jgi:hypothetical protein
MQNPMNSCYSVARLNATRSARAERGTFQRLAHAGPGGTRTAPRARANRTEPSGAGERTVEVEAVSARPMAASGLCMRINSNTLPNV